MLSISAPSGAIEPGCADPAKPLIELASRYKWPLPSSPRSLAALEQLERYLAAPSLRGYHEVLAEYKWLQQMHPSDLHVMLVLGILYTSGPDLTLPRSHGYRHNAIATESNAGSHGPDLLAEVIARDSSQWIAAVALTRVALASPERKHTEQAIAAVRSALDKDPTSDALRLAWHDLLVAGDRFKEALSFARQNPVACTAGRHALAEAMLLNNDTTGVSLYMNTLDGAKPDELYRFFDDARVLASLKQLKDYEAMSPDERPKWIGDFWKYTATASARSVQAFLSEHIVRATYSNRHFRASEFSVANGRDVAWIDDTTHIVPWDVRGVLHVRMGAPLHRFRIVNQCRESYEAWVYSGEGKPEIFWFARQCLLNSTTTTTDWRPIPGPPACGWQFTRRPVPDLETTIALLRTSPEKIDRRHIYILLAQWDDRYDTLLHECAKAGNGSTPTGRETLLEIAQETNAALSTAQWSALALPQFTRTTPITIGLYEFRNAAGRTELQAVAWVRFDGADAAGMPNSMQLSYVLTDTLLAASRKDTTVTVSVADRANGYMRTMTLLPDASTGIGKVRLIARDPADTTRGGVRTLPVDVGGSASAVALSDIVLAAEGTTGGMMRGSHAMDPIPGHILPLDAPFRLYFEAYGIARGDQINVAIRIENKSSPTAAEQLRRLFRGKITAQSLSFDKPAEISAGGVMVEDVTIAGDLAPGEYIIEIAVTTLRGTAKRFTTATVLK